MNRERAWCVRCVLGWAAMVSPLAALACGAAGGQYPGDDDDGGQAPVACAASDPGGQPAPVAALQHALRRATFTGIGDLPGGEFSSEARDVDAAGERVVGVATSETGSQAVVWTQAGGLVPLAESPSAAYAISDSGCVSVGAAQTLRAPQEGAQTMAARWVASAAVEFAPQPLSVYRRTEAIAISGDGGTILGRAFQDISPSGFVWRGDEFSNRPPDNGQNLAANEDGSVIVGRTTPSRSGGPAFALRNGEPLPYPFEPECPTCSPCITPGQCSAVAYGVSADGDVVVGSAVNVQAGGPEVAVQWVVAGDAVSASLLSASPASARAVSGDGRVIVGSEAPSGESVATRWLDGHAASITALLEAEGVSVEGWQLTSAASVSRDGRSIVGTGINPDGDTEGWLARLPLE